MFKAIIKQYFLCVSILSLTDGLWLYFAGPSFYKKNLGYIMANKFLIIPAVIFYAIYALAIMIFIINPVVNNNQTFYHLLLKASLLALCSYGAYDLTNHATIKDWPFIVTVVDMAWGIFVTSFTSFTTYYFIKSFFV